MEEEKEQVVQVELVDQIQFSATATSPITSSGGGGGGNYNVSGNLGFQEVEVDQVNQLEILKQVEQEILHQ